MDIGKLKRANIITNLIPKINVLLEMSPKEEIIGFGLSIWELSTEDKDFETKFKQLLNETKQRLQKELDEL